MMLNMPKFIEEGFGVFTDEGIKIKEDAPEWAKKEYYEFLLKLKNVGIEEEEEEED